VQIFNPATGQQFQSNGQLNVIDPSLINASAKALLAFIPLPNLNSPRRIFITSPPAAAAAIQSTFA